MDFLSPELLNGLGLAGGVTFIGWLIATGRLATKRELAEKNDTIAYQRAHIDELTAQIGILTREQGQTVIEALAGIRQAAEGVTE